MFSTIPIKYHNLQTKSEFRQNYQFFQDWIYNNFSGCNLCAFGSDTHRNQAKFPLFFCSLIFTLWSVTINATLIFFTVQYLLIYLTWLIIHLFFSIEYFLNFCPVTWYGDDSWTLFVLVIWGDRNISSLTRPEEFGNASSAEQCSKDADAGGEPGKEPGEDLRAVKQLVAEVRVTAEDMEGKSVRVWE